MLDFSVMIERAQKADLSFILRKELVGMSVESIISLGVLGWLALGMILMGLGIW